MRLIRKGRAALRFAKRNVGSCVSINDEAGLPDATRMERNPAALAPAISVAGVSPIKMTSSFETPSFPIALSKSNV